MNIREIGLNELHLLSSVPIAFSVDAYFTIERRASGKVFLSEIPCNAPYIKNYDDYGNPLSWTKDFDISNWGVFLAEENEQPIGGAAAAWNTNGVNMLEGQIDLSVLWDIRVHPDYRGRGVGRALFLTAADWSRARGCVEMKIETQNNNVNACKFYEHMGCELREFRRGAYSEPELVGEVMMLWYFKL